jgi:acetyl esterase/lipase
MGDSSGGNLVTALTILCIKLGVEVPDGAVIAYPLIALGKDYYTPSMLLSLNDQCNCKLSNIVLPY